MQTWQEEFSKQNPELARQIREAIDRAGLPSHDPAARMIAEMWVAVAALRDERAEVSRQIGDLRQTLRDQRGQLRLLLTLMGLVLVALLAVLVTR